ncbi:hypothetical protein SERLA73DRAFT_79622 [Serpula lacrymans var. lacrymans S7.3]|uniref:Uncharacterized protein n=1 Tax=Serpula lacrymans var. lacrymans (strain S7.3) TaxID=936435 RepID=F8QH05_SERL3|nr:hypothetical protein SERLA73DRAFT_79622 [Serpula lacrymans var. lacrymans S7.3]
MNLLQLKNYPPTLQPGETSNQCFDNGPVALFEPAAGALLISAVARGSQRIGDGSG